MVLVKVWLGGEGSSELGNRDKPDGQRSGALEALLLRIDGQGWKVAGATVWRRIRKYRAGGVKLRHADVRNVMGLVLEATENGAEVVSFCRDVDADKERSAAIEAGIEEARKTFPGIEIIGGSAKPALEGWILALLGHRDTDELSRRRANELLKEQGCEAKRAEDYVDIIENADFKKLPPGCGSLKTWIDRAREGLAAAIRS